MSIAAAVLCGLLALAMLGAGVPKVILKGDVPAQLQEHMGVSAGLTRFIGLAEVAAAFGLVAGLRWPPLGIAAAVGLVILLVGAIVYHQRAGDYADPKTRGPAMAPAILILISVAAAATLALRP